MVNTTAALIESDYKKGWATRPFKAALLYIYSPGRAFSLSLELTASLISVSSCVKRGGLTLRRPGRIFDTETVGGPCASCSGESARQNVRTSSHSPPSRSGTVSPLRWKHNKHRVVSVGPSGSEPFPTDRRHVRPVPQPKDKDQTNYPRVCI